MGKAAGVMLGMSNGAGRVLFSAIRNRCFGVIFEGYSDVSRRIRLVGLLDHLIGGRLAGLVASSDTVELALELSDDLLRILIYFRVCVALSRGGCRWPLR